MCLSTYRCDLISRDGRAQSTNGFQWEEGNKREMVHNNESLTSKRNRTKQNAGKVEKTGKIEQNTHKLL